MKIIKIKSSQGCLGKNKGCEEAPNVIVEKLKDFYLSEEGLLPRFDIDEVEIVESNLEETFRNIENKAKEVFKESDKAIFLGGDHSISYATIKAFSQCFENPGVIIFDAHPDAESDFIPSHEDILRAMVNENLIKAENIILVGIRNWHSEELEFLKKHKIKFYSMSEISKEGIHEVCDSVMSVAKNFSALYVSIDIDVLDPAFAPATGYAEPGGLTTRELIYFLHRLKLLRNFKAADVVEINPIKDKDEQTVKIGAKLAIELV